MIHTSTDITLSGPGGTAIYLTWTYNFSTNFPVDLVLISPPFSEPVSLPYAKLW